MSIYVIFQSLVVFSCVALCFLLVYIWSFRYAKGAKSLLFLVFCTLVWAAFSFFETSSQTLASQFFFFRLSYFGIMFIPVAWVLFAVNYTTKETGLTGIKIVPFVIFPIIIVTILWNNQWSGTYISAERLMQSGPFLVMEISYQPLYWIAAIHNYILMAVGAIVLIKRLFYDEKIAKNKAIIILIAVFLPLLSDIIFTYDLISLPRKELTPVFFTVSALFIVLGLVRYNLFMVVPFARQYIMQSIKDGILVFDTELRLVDVNSEANKILGTNQSIGKTIKELSLIYPIYQKLISSGQYIAEYKLASSGEKRLIDIEAVYMRDKNGYSIGLLIMLRDITERMRMIDQVYTNDRLASIGKLTSGVAHEINNPLAIIKGLSELLLDSTIPEDVKDDIRIIDGEVERVSNVVQNLVIFAQKQTSDKKPVNINRLLSQTLNVQFYEQNTHDIRIVTGFAKKLPKIYGNEMQVRQVFSNILMHTKDILREKNAGGTIRISTEEVPGFILIKISDDGPGIPPENISHVFEPFYTLTDINHVGDMGLSICHGIVKEHGGDISLESTEGRGTTFSIKLPAYKEVEKMVTNPDTKHQKA